MMSSIEITTLQKKPHLLSETLELIEDALDYSPPHQFAIDFYPLVKKSNHHNLHILLENNTVAAHVGLLPKILTFREHHFPVALIGAVATAKAKRGKGFFNQLMKKILEEQSRYMGYFLWGHLEYLYKKYGFYQIGIVREQKNHHFSPPLGYRRILYQELNLSQQKQLKDIYHLNTQNLISLQRDWTDVENITSSHLYIKQNRRAEITNYFFVGKGRDLPEIVHEAFGLPGHPNDTANLSCWMPDIPPYNHLPILYGCLFKISNPNLFKKFITLYSEKSLSIDKIHRDFLTLKYEHRSTNLKFENFLSGFFGPHFIEEFKKFYTPLWFSGLDSI